MALRPIALLVALTISAGFTACDDVTSGDDPASERSFDSGDLDCADVTYDEAQTLIENGDPHGLDRDGDGEACENNY